MDRIRKAFEEISMPNFSCKYGLPLDTSRNSDGEYVNESIEDNWQTFQEAVDFAVKECIETVILSSDRHRAEYFAALIKEHFGVK